MTEDLSQPWGGGVPAACETLVMSMETFRSAPYADNPGNPHNTWTTGYGSTTDGKGTPVTQGTPPVTQAEAVDLLRRDLGRAAASVKALISVSLVVREAAALISWTYNLGGDKLRDSTMRTLLNQGDRASVPGQMRLWHLQAKQPLLGLLRRRWAEAGLFVGLDPAGVWGRAQAEILTLEDWPDFGV